MDYRQLAKTLRFALSVAVVALLCGGAIGFASRRQQSQSNSPSTATPPQQISPETRATLEAIIQTGNLPDLRWPNFSDYSKHVQKFYEFIWLRIAVGQEAWSRPRRRCKLSHSCSRPKKRVSPRMTMTGPAGALG